MAVSWITPANVSPGSTGSWVDVDVSAQITAPSVSGVMLHIVNVGGSNYAVGVRNNGSTDNRTNNLATTSHMWIAVGVTSNIFEAYIGDANIQIYLVGYFGAESSFYTNALDFSLSSTGSWIDLTTIANAVAGIFQIVATGTFNFGLRMNGSTDSRLELLNTQCGFIIGLDGSGICEGQISNTGVDFFLMGMILTDAQSGVDSNVVFNLNATDLSLGGTGAWTDLAALSASARGAFIEVFSSGGAYQYGLRQNGSAENIYQYARRHCMGMVECDAGLLVEGEIGNTALDFFLIGYTVNAKPLYTTNAVNGHQALAFADVNFLSLASLLSGAAGTWVVVAQATSLPNSEQALLSSADIAGTDNYITARVKTISGNNRASLRVGYSPGSADEVYGDTNLSLNTWYIYIFGSTGSAFFIYVNNVLQTLTVNAGSDSGRWFSALSGVDNFTIASLKRSSQSGFWFGKIAEVLLYNQALSADDILFVNRYLASKYNISI